MMARNLAWVGRWVKSAIVTVKSPTCPVSVSAFWCGRVRNSSSHPSSCMISSVEGWMVSPRKSRRKSACFSSTTTSIPARASRTPSIIPAGPLPPMQPGVANRAVALTLKAPPSETTHWTGAMMAKASGISVSAVHRIWRAHGLRPHKIEQFKLSNDPKFVDKLRDVVGLYVNPPAHAIVLSVDEKSQIQALDRTQPGLPMKNGRAGTITHDYKPNGTTTLFAALNVLEGKVIGRCMPRHRHQEFIRFLNAIDAEVPGKLAIHVVLDNYATHKHPEVLAWLARHKRFTFHFTPTSCSWLNAVEGYFAKLSRRR